MKRIICAFLALVWAQTASADPMRMAVTTSFENSGLADVLLPAIKEDLDIDLQLLVVGTGQALRLGEAGDVDAILVHSKAAEEAFVAAGHGPHRREIMYNDFVVVGPVADEAQTADASSAADALGRIAAAQAPFVSRGDDSGTHKAEKAIWVSAGIDPETAGAWYHAVGAGMGAALNTAAGLDAYVLSDRASWLNFGNKEGLALLYSGDPALFNQYAFLPVSLDKNANIRNDLAIELEDWLTSPRAAELINGYTIDGETLFVFNAAAD
ncbi:MAG: substrate-binding domain-containing protein [Sulfitobacter sp.]